MLRKRLGNTVMGVRLGEHCAEKEIVGRLCSERDWVKTVLRKRLWEHCAEREIGGKLC